MRLLSDLDVSGERVFVRADLDVTIKPTNDERQTTNAEQATRLQNLKQTVDYLVEHGASQIIIAGHVDRPSFTKVTVGKPENYDPKLSTENLLPILEEILGQKISFVPDLSIHSKPGLGWVDKPGLSGGGEVFLLENLRFWPGETANDPEFAKQLAGMADVYVNEAFGNCHRAHASMVALPAFFPDVEDLIEPEGSSEPERPDGIHSRRAAGLHLQKEVEELSKLLSTPRRPLVAIVGGAKVETKVPVIENLVKVADFILVGGEIAKELASSDQRLASSDKIAVATLIQNDLDISNESIHQFQTEIAKAKTIVWNGPMGVFEKGFEEGSVAIADAIIASNAYSVVGGGETTQFLASKNLLSKFSFVSSGGGAMLAFLAGKELPGIVALE